MSERKRFFSYVIPSVLAFALSGVYAIVDGFFVGNSVGDSGLSAINIAYPVVALIQAVGTGFGMGGAVYYSISRAEKKEQDAREFVAGTMWLLITASIVMTVVFCLLTRPVLLLLGTGTGELLSLGKDYLFVISLGTFLQIFGVGLVPLIRNNGGATFAMLTMIAGFITNIVLDWLFVWVYEWSMTGAALATIIGQGVTMAGGFGYLIRKGKLSFRIPFRRFSQKAKSITKIGIAPFGLTLTPNISLILINRFSASYGGEEAIAVYACISYVISVVYLILQGVGDGSQPLMSQYYGEREEKKLRRIRNLAYRFALLLSAAGILLLFAARWNVGTLFGASEEVTRGISCFSAGDSIYRCQSYYDSRLLRHGKDDICLCSYICRTCGDAGASLYSSCFRRSDDDLVGNSDIADFRRSAGGSSEEARGQKGNDNFRCGGTAECVKIADMKNI